MQFQPRFASLFLVVLFFVSLCSQLASAAPPNIAAAAAPEQARAPLLFVENAGQLDPRARFVLRGAAATLFLADDAIWLAATERTLDTASPEQRQAEAEHAEQAIPEPGTLGALEIQLFGAHG